MDRVLYFHCRRTDEEFFDLLARGGCTFACIAQPDGNMRWGVAKCHENDGFEKRIGRIKATGKMISNNHHFLTAHMEESYARKFADALEEIMFVRKMDFPNYDMIQLALMRTDNQVHYESQNQ